LLDLEYFGFGGEGLLVGGEGMLALDLSAAEARENTLAKYVRRMIMIVSVEDGDDMPDARQSTRIYNGFVVMGGGWRRFEDSNALLFLLGHPTCFAK
jgi:hypothetical protein